ncbi:MAG: hypothetical protein RL662_108 [Bacteroidota bacterium]|jgi:hypothetical protein
MDVGEKITCKSNEATHKTGKDYNIESGTIVTIKGTDEVKLT